MSDRQLKPTVFELGCSLVKKETKIYGKKYIFTVRYAVKNGDMSADLLDYVIHQFISFTVVLRAFPPEDPVSRLSLSVNGGRHHYCAGNTASVPPTELLKRRQQLRNVVCSESKKRFCSFSFCSFCTMEAEQIVVRC